MVKTKKVIYVIEAIGYNLSKSFELPIKLETYKEGQELLLFESKFRVKAISIKRKQNQTIVRLYPSGEFKKIGTLVKESITKGKLTRVPTILDLLEENKEVKKVMQKISNSLGVFKQKFIDKGWKFESNLPQPELINFENR